ncbi:MAG: hypothetical protein QNJ78_02445 [Gammaproteobacteria bacterium]|nr:hypothetical protein [Gammaproteobacteria bacterium]
MTRFLLTSSILKFADKLRFRQLFLLTAALFVIDLLIPDMLPFADELLLGLLTLLFGSLRKPQEDTQQLDRNKPGN